ncbi:MAG: glutamate-1-semialdehyde 2,1-aminomutase, partial [Dehalococcoidia bacterium]
MTTNRSVELFEEAQRYLPGGVNSPVRAFKAVGGQPLFIKRGQGARLSDEDGNEFIDYVCSWGAGILGHAHPRIVSALRQAVEGGTSFGAPTEQETTLAKLVTSAVPSMELVRFVNSGTEATMSALRVARAFTGRDKIVKFAGCYHGHSDGLLVKAGSGVTTMGLPDSPGVPPSCTQNTLVAPYNDLNAVEQIFTASGREIAAVIVEPVAANMGVVVPRPGFLQGLREITGNSSALLIFDEVITGFRVGYGGAQALYGITPDLTCLGKIIGGGLPVGAYGGKREIMELVAPLGPVYQAGTLSGNPLAMTGGIVTLQILAEPDTYEQLEEKAASLEKGLTGTAANSRVDVFSARVGSILTMFFTSQQVSNYETARSSNTELYSRFFNNMLQSGIYLAPSQFEATFVSLAHTEKDIETTISSAEEALH